MALATWVAATKMESGAWTGLVPILFTKDAIPTQASLCKHPEKFLTGMPDCLHNQYGLVAENKFRKFFIYYLLTISPRALARKGQ